jgi:hypothetical protein
MVRHRGIGCGGNITDRGPPRRLIQWVPGHQTRRRRHTGRSLRKTRRKPAQKETKNQIPAAEGGRRPAPRPSTPTQTVHEHHQGAFCPSRDLSSSAGFTGDPMSFVHQSGMHARPRQEDDTWRILPWPEAQWATESAPNQRQRRPVERPLVTDSGPGSPPSCSAFMSCLLCTCPVPQVGSEGCSGDIHQPPASPQRVPTSAPKYAGTPPGHPGLILPESGPHPLLPRTFKGTEERIASVCRPESVHGVVGLGNPPGSVVPGQ